MTGRVRRSGAKPRRPGGRVLPFGKYEGRTIEEVGLTEKGLLYLDWLLRGARYVRPNLRRAIVCYLDHPAVAPLVNAALERRGPLGGPPSDRRGQLPSR